MRTWQNLCSAPLLTRSRGFGLSDGTAGSHFSEPQSAGRRLTPALLDVVAAGPDPGRPAHFRTRELKRPEGTVAALLTEARSQAHQSDPRERDTHGLGGDDQAVMTPAANRAVVPTARALRATISRLQPGGQPSASGE